MNCMCGTVANFRFCFFLLFLIVSLHHGSYVLVSNLCFYIKTMTTREPIILFAILAFTMKWCFTTRRIFQKTFI